MITSEAKDSEDLREKMRCQFNVLKLQVVMTMKKLEEKTLEMSDIKINLTQRLAKSKIKGGPRGDASSRSSNNRTPSDNGGDSHRGVNPPGAAPN